MNDVRLEDVGAKCLHEAKGGHDKVRRSDELCTEQ